jgi:DNA (cytosine-5)-methyltransferase 1
LAGNRLGFAETRGTLFFDVAEILRRKQPKGIFLENVKGLKIHDHGRTFEVIKNTLAEVGYVIAEDPAIVNAMNFGVPQHRERVYIIGVRRDLAEQYGITQETIQNSYPEPTDATKRFRDVKEEDEVCVKYYLSTQYIQTLINHKARHEAKGHGFGYAIVKDDEVANAIVVGGMGRERNLVIDDRLTNFTPITHIKGVVNHDGIRRMTPREWARLQGYPDEFIIPVADASAYKQFGNSVAVPAIQATAHNLLELLNIIR